MSEISLKDPSSYSTWITDIIRYSDLDPNGHVNNGAINAFFEDGRVRFRDQHMAEVTGDILAGFVLVKYTIEYHAMLHFPGTVKVGTTVIRIGSSSYTLGQGIFHDEQCIATAEVVTVRVDPETGKTTPLGEEYKDRLRHAGPNGA
jgi:acyl-CoA thioester hydrolase